MSWVRTIIAAAGVLSLSVPTVGATPAKFSIEAGQGSANAGNNFNGTVDGHLVVTVPLGAQVELTLTNEGQLPHSIQVISSGGTLPISAVPASALAFPNAQTPNPQAGTPPGRAAVARFTATTAGQYRMICGFPGHAVTGQWATFFVAPSSTAKPTVTTQ